MVKPLADFREVLKDRHLDRPPTCEQLDRFIRAVPEFIKSKPRKKDDVSISNHHLPEKTTELTAFRGLLSPFKNTLSKKPSKSLSHS